MADENNPSPKPAEDSTPAPKADEGQPAPKADDGSSAKPDPVEQARREQQSKKDKAVSEKSDLEETVEFLSSREAERERDAHVNTFLTENAEKYPNVKPDDPMFKYATSKEDVADIATQLQNKFMDMQQDALRSVQTESEQSLTDEEIAKKEEELEAETEKEGRSTFGNFIDNLGRRKKA